MLFALGATELTAKPVALRKSKKRKSRKVSNRKKRTLAKKSGKKPKGRGKGKGRSSSQSSGETSSTTGTPSVSSSITSNSSDQTSLDSNDSKGVNGSGGQSNLLEQSRNNDQSNPNKAKALSKEPGANQKTIIIPSNKKQDQLTSTSQNQTKGPEDLSRTQPRRSSTTHSSKIQPPYTTLQPAPGVASTFPSSHISQPPSPKNTPSKHTTGVLPISSTYQNPPLSSTDSQKLVSSGLSKLQTNLVQSNQSNNTDVVSINFADQNPPSTIDANTLFDVKQNFDELQQRVYDLQGFDAQRFQNDVFTENYQFQSDKMNQSPSASNPAPQTFDYPGLGPSPLLPPPPSVPNELFALQDLWNQLHVDIEAAIYSSQNLSEDVNLDAEIETLLEEMNNVNGDIGVLKDLYKQLQSIASKIGLKQNYPPANPVFTNSFNPISSDPQQSQNPTIWKSLPIANNSLFENFLMSSDNDQGEECYQQDPTTGTLHKGWLFTERKTDEGLSVYQFNPDTDPDTQSENLCSHLYIPYKEHEDSTPKYLKLNHTKNQRDEPRWIFYGKEINVVLRKDLSVIGFFKTDKTSKEPPKVYGITSLTNDKIAGIVDIIVKDSKHEMIDFKFS